MLEFSKYNHIIWDWNGTILNDVDYCRRIMNRILRKRKLPEISIEKYRDVFTFPVREYYKRLNIDISGQNWEILSHEFMNDYEKNKYLCDIFIGAKQVLSFFLEKGKSQSILSAHPQTSLTKIVTHYNLSPYFSEIIGMDNIYAESKIENGKNWIQQLGCENSEVLLIGDTLHDWEVSTAIGVDSLLIANGHQNKKALLQSNAKIINSLEELYHFLLTSKN